MNKTLNQIIADKTENVVFGNILDSATNAELKDYFLDRFACVENEDKFIRLFQRNLRMYKNQYNDLLRIQNIEFDPMVTRYLERQVIGKTTSTGSENAINSKTGNILTTNGGSVTIKTDNTTNGTGTSTEQGNSGYTNNSSGNGQSTHTGSENHNERSRNIVSLFPQANVGANTSGNLNDNVSYNYASNMTDNKSNGEKSDSTTDSTTSSGHDTGSANSTNNINSSNRDVFDGLQTQTNNSNSNKAITESGNNSLNKSGEENSDIRERLTGRENYDSAVLLEHARDYISSTNAFRKFLVPHLEKCFIGNLRYGEE